jgi:hypothetical protein
MSRCRLEPRAKQLAKTFEERRAAERRVEDELRRLPLAALRGLRASGTLREDVRLAQVLDDEITRKEAA